MTKIGQECNLCVRPFEKRSEQEFSSNCRKGAEGVVGVFNGLKRGKGRETRLQLWPGLEPWLDEFGEYRTADHERLFERLHTALGRIKG